MSRIASSACVRKEFERLLSAHGQPAVLLSDNGPEFVAFELTEGLEKFCAATFHVEPRKPRQSLHDGCLNMEELWSLPHARALTEAWRIDYDSEHVHSSLGYLRPDEFAARCAAAIEQHAA